MVRRGRMGAARLGRARRGKAGMVWPGEASLGKAGLGRTGRAWFVPARQGLAGIGRLVAHDLRQRKEDEMNAGHHQVEAQRDNGR